MTANIFTENWFTVVAGIATLISLFLQLKPIFPRYKDVISKLLFILLGLFIGSIVGGLKVENIDIEYSGSILSVVVTLIQFMLGFMGVYLLFKQVYDNKDYGETIFVCFLMFFLLFGYHVFSAMPNLSSAEDRLTTQEWGYLATQAENNKNYDRAILFYGNIKSRLRDADQKEKINKKIKELTEKSVGIGQ